MDKPLLIFVHGMFCHAEVWRKMVAYFEARGYKCLALDLPYHDRPPYLEPDPRLGSTSIRDYVRFLEGVLADLKQDYVLIGHSMGGLIVMKTAGLPHVNPRSVLLLAPAAPRGISALEWSVILAFLSIMKEWAFWRKPVLMGLDDLQKFMLNTVPEPEAYEIAVELRHESGRAGAEMGFWPLDIYRSTKINPAGITCPITLLVGDQDLITPPIVVAKIARMLANISFRERLLARWQRLLGRETAIDLDPRVELIILPDDGHWLPTLADCVLIERLLEKG